MLHDELQRLQVVGGQRRNINRRLRQVNAFFRAEFFAFRSRLGDFHGHGIRVHRADHAANFPVVKPDRIARLGMIEDLRKRNANLGGRDQLAGLAVLGRLSRRVSPRQQEAYRPVSEAASAASAGSSPMRALRALSTTSSDLVCG